MFQETNDVTAELHALVICFDNRCVIYRHPHPLDYFPKVPTQAEHCATRDLVYIWANMFTRMCVPLKSELQNTGPWSAAAWPHLPPRPPVLSPNSILPSHPSHYAMILWRKTRLLFPQCYDFNFCTIIKFFMSEVAGSVCSGRMYKMQSRFCGPHFKQFWYSDFLMYFRCSCTNFLIKRDVPLCER
jgi:hypothetical protein